MEKALVKVNKQLADKNFDLAKSSHAVSIFYVLFKLSISLIFTKLFFPPDCFQTNVTKIFAKAYIQLGRFTKTNDSKTVSIISKKKLGQYQFEYSNLYCVQQMSTFFQDFIEQCIICYRVRNSNYFIYLFIKSIIAIPTSGWDENI